MLLDLDKKEQSSRADFPGFRFAFRRAALQYHPAVLSASLIRVVGRDWKMFAEAPCHQLVSWDSALLNEIPNDAVRSTRREDAVVVFCPYVARVAIQIKERDVLQ